MPRFSSLGPVALARRALAALVFVAVGVLAGCREGDGPPANGPVVISVWHQKDGGEREFFNRQVAAFNAAHAGRVQIEALYRETEELRNLFVIASVGGQGPDLIFGPSDNVSILAMTGSVRPVTDILPPAFLAQFDTTGVLTWGPPGEAAKAWMVADQVGNHLAFAYNKALLPTVPETWEELLPMLQRLTTTKDGSKHYGLTWNYTEPFFFVPFLTGEGGWMMTPEGQPTLDTPETVRAIQFVIDLRDKYKVIPGESDYNVAETLFKEGRAAAIINGPWAWAGYRDAGIDLGIARIPKMATGRWAAPVVSSKGYSVNVNVPEWKVPYVREVLEAFAGPAMQRQMADSLSTIPVIASVVRDSTLARNPILAASMNQAAVGLPMPTAPQLRQVWDGMRGPYQLVMNGAVTPQQGARLMQQEVQKRINDTFL